LEYGQTFPRNADSNAIRCVVGALERQFALHVGVRAPGRPDEGRPIRSRKARALVLTTKGRRSGRKRSVVLPYFTVDDKTFVVGSKGGAPEDPDWVRNLQATPVATVFIDRRPCIVATRVATPAERALLWARLIAVAPTYDAYQKGTAREIPLMILERL
jgi:deazaflavin-dependent oxidoreductase (nitroreductase family)